MDAPAGTLISRPELVRYRPPRVDLAALRFQSRLSVPSPAMSADVGGGVLPGPVTMPSISHFLAQLGMPLSPLKPIVKVQLLSQNKKKNELMVPPCPANHGRRRAT